MKTSYELAMERLKKSAPVAKLSTAQKNKLAELDSKYAARIAERELALKDDAAKAAAAGEFEKIEQLQQQLSNERNAIRAELEDKKNRIRAAAPKP
jgi:hypothetical protein